MSGIAELLLNLDFTITGSDISKSQNVNRLESRGVKISIGHSAENIENVDVVVYSSAVKQENIEILTAKKRNIPVIRRAEMLAQLINLKETSIAIGGTHGKTTTSSMVGTVLEGSNFDPTLVVGGLVSNLNSNVKLGHGDIIVVEADEYDRSFLALNPTIAIITNLEMEHTDCYANIEELESAFLQFCNSIPFYGEIILCADSEALMKRGAKEVHVYVTHGVLSGEAVEKIKKSRIKKLVITDTIDNSNKIKKARNIEVLTISNLLGEAIKRISNSTSVSDLFK